MSKLEIVSGAGAAIEFWLAYHPTKTEFKFTNLTITMMIRIGLSQRHVISVQ